MGFRVSGGAYCKGVRGLGLRDEGEKKDIRTIEQMENAVGCRLHAQEAEGY
jgi:hypothetical protein